MRIHKVFRGVPILLGLSVLVVLLLGSAVKKGKKSPSVQEQLNQISASISAIDSLLRDQEGASRRIGADLMVRIEALERQVQVLNSKITDNSNRLARFSEKLDAIQLYGGGRPVSSDGDTSKPAKAVMTFKTNLKVDPKTLYDSAYSDLKEGNYQLAIAEFSRYLSDFPQTDLADNAQYWIGECYYVQGEYKKALVEFQKVLGKYPNSEKIPGVLLKMGYTLSELKDHKGAVKYLKDLVKKFPSSYEAKLAKERLKSVSKKSRR